MIGKQISIALIGCGRISKSHINAIIENYGRCELAAIVDNSKIQIDNSLKLIYEKYKLEKLSPTKPKIFLSYEDLITAHKKNKINIDLVVLATPSGMHSMQTITAAKNGINVCTEKPMALSYEEASDMVEICEREKVTLFVVKQTRLNKTIIDIKKKVRDKLFGNIGVVSINVFWHRSQEYYDKNNWRGTKDQDGGVLMNQAIHYVDLLEWIIGPIKSLSSYTSTRSRKIETEDTAVLALEWENGALGTMAVTMVTYPKNLESSITIIGDKGSIKLGGKALDKYEYSFFEIDENRDNDFQSKLKNNKQNDYGHCEYYKNILDVLEGKSDPVCSGADSLSSIKLINLAYKASREKRIINLIE